MGIANVRPNSSLPDCIDGMWLSPCYYILKIYSKVMYNMPLSVVWPKYAQLSPICDYKKIIIKWVLSIYLWKLYILVHFDNEFE